MVTQWNLRAAPERVAEVVVVEDDHDLGAFLLAVLSDAGWGAVHTTSLAGARALLSSTPVRVLVLDRGLEVDDAVSHLEELAEVSLNPDLRVLVVSGRVDYLDRVEALAAGADDYLRKPVDSAELQEVVARLAGAPGSYAPEAAATTLTGPAATAPEPTAWFEPVVELTTLEILGFSAVPRLADGGRPYPTQLAAHPPELEWAFVVEALRAADELPDGSWLSVDLSLAALRCAPAELPSVGHRRWAVDLGAVSDPQELSAAGDALTGLPGEPSAIVGLPDDLGGRPGRGVGPASMIRLGRAELATLRRRSTTARRLDELVAAAEEDGITVIADGIETEDERHVCRMSGITVGRGPLFGAAAEASAWADRDLRQVVAR